jgi:hypothetical protein
MVRIENTAKGRPVIAAPLGTHQVGDIVTTSLLYTRDGEWVREEAQFRVTGIGKEFVQSVYIDEEDARSLNCRPGRTQRKIAYHYVERI